MSAMHQTVPSRGRSRYLPVSSFSHPSQRVWCTTRLRPSLVTTTRVLCTSNVREKHTSSKTFLPEMERRFI
jgi:hypothetical protein